MRFGLIEKLPRSKSGEHPPTVGTLAPHCYRFYSQRPILDPEPLLAGSSTTPFFIITGLTPGQEYLLYVTATNAGGESELSEPATATVLLAAAA